MPIGLCQSEISIVNILYHRDITTVNIADGHWVIVTFDLAFR